MNDTAATGYGKNRLVILPVDPYLVHAYWEVASPELEVRTSEEAVQPVLRFYRSGKASPTVVDWFDIEIDLRCRRWYVRLWSPEESLYADLALRKRDGTLVRLAQSLLVHMPRTVPAIAVEQHFVKLTDAPTRTAVYTPAEPSPPRHILVQPTHKLAVRSSPKVAISPALVREKLNNLYESLQLRRHDHVIELEVPRAVASTTPRRNDDDLTTSAERVLVGNLSSSSLQKNQDSSRPSSKR